VLDGSELLTTITNGRVVRAQLGALPALRDGLDAGHRAVAATGSGRPTPASAESSTPTGASSSGRRLFQEAGLVGEVRFLQARTIYAALGDVVPWTACGMLGWACWL
jgi:hypothetical protein